MPLASNLFFLDGGAAAGDVALVSALRNSEFAILGLRVNAARCRLVPAWRPPELTERGLARWTTLLPVTRLVHDGFLGRFAAVLFQCGDEDESLDPPAVARCQPVVFWRLRRLAGRACREASDVDTLSV